MWVTWMLLAVAGLQSAAGAGTRNYDIVFQRIEDFEKNPEYFGPDTEMHLRRHNKTSSPLLYDTLEIVKPLPNDTIVEVTLYEMHDNQYVPSFLKYRNNLCDYISKEKRPIFRAIGEDFKFPPTCPIVGTYKLEGWSPPERFLPPFLPGAEHWKLGFKLTSGKTILTKHSVVFLIDRSKIVRGRG